MALYIFRKSILNSGSYLILTRNYQNSFKSTLKRYVKTQPKPSDKYPYDGSKSWVRLFWNKLFGKYLLTTNIVSSAILMAAGDILSQEIEYQRGISSIRFDWERVGRMFMCGSLQGPLHHYFYKWMDDLIPAVTIKTTIWKILLDEGVMSPICLLLFFYPACLLEGKTLDESTKEIKSKFLTIYLVDWCVWPAAQFLNFHYLHPKYRVIYINIVTMLYNVFLSYMKHKE